MSDVATEDEPTMEEILASIRRIISDDDVEGEAANDEEVAEDFAVPGPEPEVDVMPEVEPEPEPEPEPEIELVEEAPEPDPEPEPEEDVFELTDVASPQDLGDVNPIVSEPVENKTAESFAHLTQLMVSGYPGTENTLEALVREMLRPMLQTWLDQNLPSIVQDAVEREVARISRRT